MQTVKTSKTFILAGGVGLRLWPLSSIITPKQFLKIFSNKSLFQQTVERNLTDDSPVIIVSKEHVEIVKIQLEEIGISPDYSEIEIIVEPVRRNTAASVITAAHHAKKHGIDNIIIAPCDHVINDTASYRAAISEGLNLLQSSKIVALAVQPDSFSSEFGYIEAAKKVDGSFGVKSFIEKPSKEPQGLFTSNKYYFWNSGIYLMNAEYIINQAGRYWQFFEKMIQTAYEAARVDSNITYLSGRFYQHIENKPFDVVFSEKIASQPGDDMQIVKANFDWVDMGSWTAIMKKIIETYPVNSRIKHEKTLSSNINNKIYDLVPDEIYDFAPKMLVLEDVVAIIHGEHLSIASRCKPSKVLTMEKSEFLNSKNSNNFLSHLGISS